MKELGLAIRKHALAGCQTLPEMLDLVKADPSVPQEDRDYFESTVRPCIITRGKRKGGLRASPAPGSSNATHCFLRAYHWHGGATGGNLGGPMGDSLRFPNDYDLADTLAVTLRVAIGRPMVSADRWWRVLHG